MKVAKTAKKSAKGWAGYKVAKGAGKTVKRKARRGPSTRERVVKIAGAVGITAAIGIVLAKLDRRKAVGKVKGAASSVTGGKDYDDATLAHKVETELFRPDRRAQGPGVGQRQRRRGRAARRAPRSEADRRAGRERPQDRRRQGRPQPAAHRHERRLATARNNEGGAAVYVGMLSYSSLSAALADERERAIREKARDAWRRQQSGRLKLRNATFADAADLHRLARLDSQPYPPSGRLVVAVEDGVMIAAVAVESGEAIADPFRSTAPVVALLRLRAQAMRISEPPRRRIFGRFARVRGAAA